MIFLLDQMLHSPLIRDSEMILIVGDMNLNISDQSSPIIDRGVFLIKNMQTPSPSVVVRFT